LWSGKSSDEALELVEQFRVANGISHEEAPQFIDITELM
jgi:hypothetical protein